MPDVQTPEQAAGAPPPAPATPPPASPPAQKPPDDDEDRSITSFPPAAQEVIRQLRDENAKHRQEARKQKDAAERAERDKLAEAGEWKQAYERVTAELEPLKLKADRAEAVEAFVQKALKARIDALPEQYRTLVPKYDDPLKTLTWLDQSAPLLTPPKAPSLDAGAQGSGRSSAPLTADELAMARQMGVSEEAFKKSRDAKLAQQQK
jgi:phage I-like protein